MGVPPLPQRVARAVGESPVAERVADAQAFVYRPVFVRTRDSRLHTDVLGHSLHPMLTDVTLGCWLGASILDLAGGAQERRAAYLLIGCGLAASVPTAITGAGDWEALTGAERRIGAVHALGVDTAGLLHAVSLVMRLRGRHGAGSGLSLAGNAVALGAGFLGGHLALRRGTARRDHPGEGGPDAP